MNNLTIEFARLQDLEKCLDFDFFYMKEILKENIEKERVIVAKIEDNIIGYLRIEYLWHHIPYIALITVEEEFQKKGIGKGLLIFLIQYLQKKQAKFLLSSSTANELEPQNWHLKMGFTEIGTLAGINGSGIGEIFFRKDI